MRPAVRIGGLGRERARVHASVWTGCGPCCRRERGKRRDRFIRVSPGRALRRSRRRRSCRPCRGWPRSRHVAAGAPILREAEPGDLFFVLVRGEVKVFVDSPDGREVVLTHLQAGDFFGEMALLEGEPRSASVTALTESELVVARARGLLRPARARLRAHAQDPPDAVGAAAALQRGDRVARAAGRRRPARALPRPPRRRVGTGRRWTATSRPPADAPGDRQLDRRHARDRHADAQAVRGPQAHPRSRGRRSGCRPRCRRARAKTSGDAVEGSLDSSQLHHPRPPRRPPVLPRSRSPTAASASPSRSSWRRASRTASTGTSPAAST